MMAAAMVLGAGALVSADELSDAQYRLNKLKKQQEEVREKLAELEAARTDLSTYIEKLDAEMADLDAQHLEILTRQEQLTADLAETEEKLAEAEATSKEQYEAMKLRIRYMYERGDTGFFDLLFSARDLADFLNRSEYISELTDYDRTMLKLYQQTQQEIGDRKVQLQTTQVELDQASAELAVQQETLELLAQAKRDEMAAYESQIAEVGDDLAAYEYAMEAEQDNIDAIVAEIKRQEEEAKKEEPAPTEKPVEPSTQAPTDAPTQKPTDAPEPEPEPEPEQPDQSGPNADGGWVWPAPTCRIITDYYGGSRNHKGIDIAMYGDASGQPIVAVAPGTVVVSRYSSSAGNWIVIYHGEDSKGRDVYTCYMHCSKLQVSTGQKVSAGQQIGLIGNTGQSFGAHLHFEIRYNSFAAGSATSNPLNYISP